MQDAIAAQGAAQDQLPARRGAQGQERLLRRGEAHDGPGLLGREGQSVQVEMNPFGDLAARDSAGGGPAVASGEALVGQGEHGVGQHR
ncbi:MAG TPA: hypothetical protein VIA62_27195 [Thermoanaerobaculia bacterium]|nr:hypothetical protein [Thermoanaerobaculia bacterium]